MFGRKTSNKFGISKRDRRLEKSCNFEKFEIKVDGISEFES